MYDKEKQNIIYKLDNLQRYYISKIEIVKAVNGINLNIYAGEFVSILGPSGSGKTTLLNLLSGLDKPTGGKLYYKDKDMAILSDNQLCDLRRYDIGIIFQFYNLHPSFTAIENIEYPMMIAKVPKEERYDKALKLIRQMKLEDKKDNFPVELSGGEKQRIGIARSLANDPSVIIADEPTGDLDTENARSILGLLYEVNREEKKTIIMVTHDESLISEESRVIQLVDGKII
ncbi:MAG: ABC transporter ATP-binding protein [Candidatus Hodarchaeales archaeon]